MGKDDRHKRDMDYMARCIQLAKLGAGAVAPNPMVGSVLVYQDRIIGEGYHQQYGQAHAEVNCINSVAPADEALVSLSTLYVSLEPCAHFGKTPPCADLIIHRNIPRVVVGCRDPFDKVNGKGIEKLQSAGVEVTLNVLEDECLELNKRFFTFHTKRRPYIILKWAQTADHRIAAAEGQPRLLISNDHSNRLVHRWRQEEAAIFVGRKTVELDNPSLNNRLWTGGTPVRLVLDPSLSLPVSANVFDGSIPTLVFNYFREEKQPNLHYHQVEPGNDLLAKILDQLYKENVLSVLVEGGAQLLQTFVADGLWDEARIITNESIITGTGLNAPVLPLYNRIFSERSTTDLVEIFINKA